MRAVVIGSGLGGVTVAETLAKGGGGHDITLVTGETLGYYSRPRLSHGMALADAAAEKILMKRYDALPFKVLSDTKVDRIDRESQRVVLQGGKTLDYDVLVLATGSAARVPPPLVKCEVFLTLNSLAELHQLRARRREALGRGATPRWAIVGGGLIGCELASDLRKAGDEVTIFHREPRLIELILTEPQSRALHDHFVRTGVEVRYRQDVRSVSAHEVVTAEGTAGPFDGVVVATGFAPRVELAREAGLPAKRGIVTDAFLRTADPKIYAVGDVAEVEGRLYPFVSPIRHQALWLAQHLEGRAPGPWAPPAFKPVIKVHGFNAEEAATA